MTAAVTIGMSVRNAERTLAQAIASVRRQTRGDWELVIVDDGSTDRSLELASASAAVDPRIRVIAGGVRAGLAVRLNQLVDATSTHLFARMDADDVAYPRRLEHQLDFLESHPQVDLVGTSMLVFGAGGLAIGKRRAPAGHAAICSRPNAGFRLFHPTWVGRTAWFRAHRYAPAAVRCEDQDVLHRSYRSSVFANVETALLGYREEELRLTRMLEARATLARRVVGRLLSERRAGAAAAAVASQAARGGLDAVAVATGLEHRLLPQRARALSSAERSEWSAVWSASLEQAAVERVEVAHEPLD